MNCSLKKIAKITGEQNSESHSKDFASFSVYILIQGPIITRDSQKKG